MFIDCTQAINNSVSLLKKKHYVSKHLNECSKEDFKIIPKCQTNDYSLFQMKEKDFIDLNLYLTELNCMHANAHTQTYTHQRA